MLLFVLVLLKFYFFSAEMLFVGHQEVDCEILSSSSLHRRIMWDLALPEKMTETETKSSSGL